MVKNIKNNDLTPSVSNLDPDNWDDFRQNAHKLLDACIDHLENTRRQPWQPVDDKARQALTPPLSNSSKSTAQIIDSLIKDVMPFATGNTHPRFFGWVHGTGMASCLLADMVASAMNSNCGGRDHGAIYVERCVLDWCKEIFMFPKEASGLLTVGTSQATLLALVTARTYALGVDTRYEGIRNTLPLTAYCAEGAHSCVEKTLQVMGHGSDILRKIKTHGLSGGMDISALRKAIDQDIKDGFVPLCVVATAGSVNTGAFDDFNAIADLCAEHDIWLHVDGAFGAWAKIAEAPWSDLVNGMERANSIAFDFHKWMSMQYDCGALLIKNSQLHFDSFAMRPSYLVEQERGLGGGDLWFCDFGIDLSRGFRALKVWTALQNQGLEAFSKAITDNCRHAAYMANIINASDELTLAAPVISNVCTFYVNGCGVSEEIVHKLQLSGDVVFSTTQLDGRTVIRAAITNHRTHFKDIDFAINAVIRLALLEKG